MTAFHSRNRKIIHLYYIFVPCFFFLLTTPLLLIHIIHAVILIRSREGPSTTQSSPSGCWAAPPEEMREKMQRKNKEKQWIVTSQVQMMWHVTVTQDEINGLQNRQISLEMQPQHMLHLQKGFDSLINQKIPLHFHHSKSEMWHVKRHSGKHVNSLTEVEIWSAWSKLKYKKNRWNTTVRIRDLWYALVVRVGFFLWLISLTGYLMRASEGRILLSFPAQIFQTNLRVWSCLTSVHKSDSQGSLAFKIL